MGTLSWTVLQTLTVTYSPHKGEEEGDLVTPRKMKGCASWREEGPRTPRGGKGADAPLEPPGGTVPHTLPVAQEAGCRQLTSRTVREHICAVLFQHKIRQNSGGRGKISLYIFSKSKKSFSVTPWRTFFTCHCLAGITGTFREVWSWSAWTGLSAGSALPPGERVDGPGCR